MGRLASMDMSNQVAEGNVSLDNALLWHLQGNHYPPHPAFMVDVAKEAIENAMNEDLDVLIDLPEDVEHRRYGTSVPTEVILEELHLWEFVYHYEE